MSDTVSSLRAEAKRILVQARAHTDKSTPTAADVTCAEELMDKADRLNAKADATERVQAMRKAAGFAQPDNQAVGLSTAQLHGSLEGEIDLLRALGNVDSRIVGNEMPAEFRAEWNRRVAPQNAAGTGSGPSGGYAVAPAFMNELLVAMKAQGGMQAASYGFTTASGSPLTWPTQDDRSQSGRLLTAENAQLGTATDLSFGIGNLGAFTFVSDVALVSKQLLQDSASDFGKVLVTALASRLARAENPYFTNGTGVNQPRGVLLDAALGVTGAAGSTTSISADNTMDLIASVDPAYRKGAVFMMHDNTLQAYRKLKDSTGRYLHNFYQDLTNGGTPIDTILGYPVVINQDMPVMAAGAKSVLFGAFENYKIRTVVDVQVLALTERYADANQVGYIAWIRSDGRLISGGQPLKYYQNSAT